jgi:hypothetical protein
MVLRNFEGTDLSSRRLGPLYAAAARLSLDSDPLPFAQSRATQRVRERERGFLEPHSASEGNSRQTRQKAPLTDTPPIERSTVSSIR